MRSWMATWSLFGANLGDRGRLLELTWRSWATLGRLLGPLGRFLNPSWAQLGDLGRLLGSTLEPLGRNLELLGRLFVPYTSDLGSKMAFGAPTCSLHSQYELQLALQLPFQSAPDLQKVS